MCMMTDDVVSKLSSHFTERQHRERRERESERYIGEGLVCVGEREGREWVCKQQFYMYVSVGCVTAC